MLRSQPFIVFTLIFALIMLFAAAGVMAFCTEPCAVFNYTDPSCGDPPPMPTDCGNRYSVTDSGSGWTVTLCISDHPGSTTLKDYNYQAFNSSGTSSGLRKIDWFCPKCCTDPVMEVYEDLSSPNIRVEDPGVGSPTGALKNFLQGFAVWSSPADNISYTLVTNAQQTTEGTVLLELAGNDVPITFPVPGCAPATPPPPVGGRNFTQCINFGEDTPEFRADDVSLYVVRSATLAGCAARVWSCNAPRCPGCTNEQCTNTDLPEGVVCEELPPEALPDNVVFTGNINPVCQDESAEVTHGSPFYLYTLNSGGVTRKICYDIGVEPPQKVDRCCCRGTCACD